MKIHVSDRKENKVTTIELDGVKARPLIGRQLGDEVDGSIFGMPGKRLMIRGGSDKDGIPMVGNIHGGTKKYVLLAGGVGFKPARKGERRRKLVRGRMITDETYQLNMVFSASSSKKVSENQDVGGNQDGDKASK